MDFDHDDLTSGGKAGITFQMVDCLNDTAQMNSSNTNSGGWNSSAMRSRMSTYLSQIPSALQSAIKTVSKKSGTGGGSSSGTQTTSDKLFLLSEIEIFGKTTYSVAGEGNQYEYYAAGNSTIKKSMVLRTTGGSVLRMAATPPTSAVSAAAATPTIAPPATVMACPSASAFNPSSSKKSRPGRGGEKGGNMPYPLVLTLIDGKNETCSLFGI